MRKSEHFNLNLVEGSDIVNPLVTDVPNYESIDNQMFKNQNAGVQNATELKTGTVHAITRVVPDAQMITFTATSNFVAGDTFTVDGIQVSALTVSGEQLPTGAYVINSQVLAILKGTLLTVYGVGSEVADNALALNGHPDTYFGTKESVDNAIATANAANELVNELNNSLVDRTTWKDSGITPFSYPYTVNISSVVENSTEIMFVGKLGQDNMIITIPTILLTSSNQYFDIGFSLNGKSYFFQILANTKNVQLTNFVYGDMDKKSDAKVSILYR